MSAPTMHAETVNMPTCPSWCVAAHNEDTTLHLQADVAVADLRDKLIEISAFHDEKAGRSGVYVGDYEVPLSQIPAFKAALARAEQALMTIGAAR